MTDEIVLDQKTVKKSKKKWLWLLLPLFLAIIAFIVIAILLMDAERPRITFTSVDYDSTYVYAYVESSTSFEPEDFAIKIDNDLISAEKIEHERYSSYYTICFEVSYRDIDKPTTIYYKGEKLTVGDTIKVW